MICWVPPSTPHLKIICRKNLRPPWSVVGFKIMRCTLSDGCSRYLPIVENLRSDFLKNSCGGPCFLDKTSQHFCVLLLFITKIFYSLGGPKPKSFPITPSPTCVHLCICHLHCIGVISFYLRRYYQPWHGLSLSLSLSLRSLDLKGRWFCWGKNFRIIRTITEISLKISIILKAT